jgi:hypothetical protein
VFAISLIAGLFSFAFCGGGGGGWSETKHGVVIIVGFLIIERGGVSVFDETFFKNEFVEIMDFDNGCDGEQVRSVH